MLVKWQGQNHEDCDFVFNYSVFNVGVQCWNKRRRRDESSEEQFI